MKPRALLRRCAPPLAVAAVAFSFQLPFFDRWLSVMDEGHMLQFADIVAQGGMLYRDATIYPLPGAFYLLALAFRIFDPSILLSRWLVVLEFTAFAVIVYLLVRRIVSSGYAILCIALLLLYRVWAFPHWQMYNYSTTALLVLTASLLAVVRFLETDDRRILAFAGLVFGLGVFCKQDYGAVTLLAVGFTLAVYARSGPPESRRRLLPVLGVFLGPAALVGAAAGLHFLAQGQLRTVFQLTVLNHFIGLSTYDYQSFPSLLPLFQQDPVLRTPVGLYNNLPTIVLTAQGRDALESALYAKTAFYDTAIKALIYGPNLLILGGAVRIWRRRSDFSKIGERERALSELALFSTGAATALLIAFYKPQDYVHLAVLYWPFLCLGVVYAQALLRGRRALALAAAALMLLPAAAVAGYTGFLVWRLRETQSERLPLSRGGIFAKPEEARLLVDLVDYVRANSSPDEPVAAIPYLPIVHFLADRDAPHAASYIVWPFPEYPDRDQRIIHAMEATNTSLVLYSFAQFQRFPRMEAYAPELFAYLVENFEIDRVFSNPGWGMTVAGLVRSGEAPAGRALVADDVSNAELAIEFPDGTRRPVPPDRRGELVETALWPFRAVVAQRPLTGGRRSVMTISADVPPGSRLRTAVSVHPAHWFKHPPATVTFQVRAVDAGARTLLTTRTINPQGNYRDRHWFEVDVPLDAYGGRRIDLEFTTETNRTHAEILEMGGWAIPRLVTSPASGPRPPNSRPGIEARSGG